jgi:hypothetical protein
MLVQHRGPIFVGAHPKLCVPFAVPMGKLGNKALFTLTSPLILHYCVEA